MTEAHAVRDDLASEQPGDDGVWPGAVATADLADGAGNAVALPPPVPALTGPPGLVAEDGTRLVAGLAWEVATGPETPVLRGNAPPVLRLPSRRARLADAGTGPCGSLLLQMAADLTTIFFPAASGAWAFIAELPEADHPPTLWMAVADIAMPPEERDGPLAGGDIARHVTPRPGPERTFEDPEDAIGALQALLELTPIAGIAVRWLPIHPGMTPADTHRGAMITAITACAATVEFHDVGPDVPHPPGFDRDAAPALRLPVFAPPRQLPVRLIGAFGIGAGTLLAGFFVAAPIIEAAFRPEELPPPEMVSVQVAPGAFASACTATLDAWWPRVTGWRLDNTGCALAGRLPAEPALPEPQPSQSFGRPMAVWRHLVPESGRNPILARAAADQLISSWPHEARVDENGLTLWRATTLPMARTDTSGGAEAPSPDRIGARLAALWADSPDAVSDLGRGLFRIGTSGAPAEEVLSRAARVPGIAPVRLVQSEEGVGELVLAPVVPREVPLEMFEPMQGGSSQ